MVDFFSSGDVIQDKNAKSLSYYFTKDVVRIDRHIVDQLVEESARNGNCNARICLHTSPTDNFHEMIILQRKGRYYRPHKHLTKGESYHVIEGAMATFVFDEGGSVVDACSLDAHGNFIYPVGANMYHTVMPLSDLVIYHESKPGPFFRDQDSVYPAWAPDGRNEEEVFRYEKRLLQTLSI